MTKLLRLIAGSLLSVLLAALISARHDLIHSYSFSAGAVTAPANVLFRVPVVTVHETLHHHLLQSILSRLRAPAARTIAAPK